MMTTPARAIFSPGYYASHWRSLDYFNLYRLALAAALLMLGLINFSAVSSAQTSPEAFRAEAAAYLISAAFFVLGVRARWPGFQLQLTAHVLTDIVFLTAMMASNPGMSGGLGLLMVVSVASGGLAGKSRLVLLYAALASLAVLLQQVQTTLTGHASLADFPQTGLLCVGYFAAAILAHALTRRALSSEYLAARQADELARLARINALVIEDSSDGILAVDAAGTLRHISPRAHVLLGSAPKPPEGQVSGGMPLADALPENTLLADYCPTVAEAFAQWRAQPTRASQPLLLGGHRLRIRFIPLAETSGETVLVLEDMSRAEHAAQQIKLAALGRLTANIAHEIRNPLAAIQQAAQLLREESPEGTSARLTHIIESNTLRLDHLVSDVLTLNRRDRTRPENISPEDELSPLLAELCQAEEIPQNAVTIEMRTTQALCFDREHLRQILWNLLRNAWRHCQQHTGSVRLSTTADTRRMYFDISDDGPGVAPEHQGKLFEPFFTTDAQGTGLGLFLARELAEANGGTLEWRANTPGACFRLSARLAPCY